MIDTCSYYAYCVLFYIYMSLKITERSNRNSKRNRRPKYRRPKKKRMTHKQIFDKLYDKYLYMKPKEHKQAIYADMKSFFTEKITLT